MFTPAFLTAHHATVPYWGAAVRLRPGVDVTKFVTAVQRLVLERDDRVPAGSCDVGRGPRPLPDRQSWPSRCSVRSPRCSASWWSARPTSRRMQIDVCDNAALRALGTTRPQRGGGRHGPTRRGDRCRNRARTRDRGAGITAGTGLRGAQHRGAPGRRGRLAGARARRLRHPPHRTGHSSVVPVYRWAKATTDDVARVARRWRESSPQREARSPRWVGIRFGLEPGAGRAVCRAHHPLAAATAVALGLPWWSSPPASITSSPRPGCSDRPGGPAPARHPQLQQPEHEQHGQHREGVRGSCRPVRCGLGLFGAPRRRGPGGEARGSRSAWPCRAWRGPHRHRRSPADVGPRGRARLDHDAAPEHGSRSHHPRRGPGARHPRAGACGRARRVPGARPLSGLGQGGTRRRGALLGAGLGALQQRVRDGARLPVRARAGRRPTSACSSHEPTPLRSRSSCSPCCGRRAS